MLVGFYHLVAAMERMHCSKMDNNFNCNSSSRCYHVSQISSGLNIAAKFFISDLNNKRRHYRQDKNYAKQSDGTVLSSRLSIQYSRRLVHLIQRTQGQCRIKGEIGCSNQVNNICCSEQRFYHQNWCGLYLTDSSRVIYDFKLKNMVFRGQNRKHGNIALS